jgi:hypothetical protein
MLASGQKETFRGLTGMSALPADIGRHIDISIRLTDYESTPWLN